jgi:hypothetical protein
VAGARIGAIPGAASATAGSTGSTTLATEAPTQATAGQTSATEGFVGTTWVTKGANRLSGPRRCSVRWRMAAAPALRAPVQGRRLMRSSR